MRHNLNCNATLFSIPSRRVGDLLILTEILKPNLIFHPLKAGRRPDG